MHMVVKGFILFTGARECLVSAGMVVLLLVTTSCSGSNHENSEARRSSPPAASADVAPSVDPSVDYLSVATVCESFARTIHTVDAASDPDPDIAYRRARPYVTFERYAAIRTQPRTRTSAEWETWKQHQAKTQVALHPFAGDGGIDKGQRTHSVVVDVTPAGRDGWIGPTASYAVHCGLNSQDSQWRVAYYDVEEITP